jgi:membrane protein YqaA with SNARE-associated domain
MAAGVCARIKVVMVKGIVHTLFITFAHLGGLGVLILSAIDSSPLLIPLGNDLLFVAMTARKHDLMVYYVFMEVAGSVLGCLIVDALSRKGGEEGLEKTLPRGRLEAVKKRVRKSASWALVLASLMPPPFPFTPFVAGAAAFQYPRKKLLAVVSAARFARFLLEGLLAIHFGRHLLRLENSALLEYMVIALLVVSIGGSGLAVLSWSRRKQT